jgi:DNA-binding transcriptional LysR family regulator
MDRLEGMRVFVAVVKAEGFSAAARQLGMPLATVSRRIIDLEADLGVRLLQRTTRRLSLTDQGRDFFVACGRILDDIKDATEAVSGEYRAPKGELTITAPFGFGRMHLQPVILEFLALYPEIRLRLMLVDRLVNLVEEHVDAAIRIAELRDSRLIARKLGAVRIVLTASPDYIARRGMPRHPGDLADHDCIAWAALGQLPTWEFQEEGRVQAHQITARLWTTVAESAVAAAEAGLGLVQSTCYQAEQGLREGRLVLLLPAFECPETLVHLVYPSNRLLPLKLRAFFDFVIPRNPLPSPEVSFEERILGQGMTIISAAPINPLPDN